MTRNDYTREERRRLVDAWRDGVAPACPRCGSPLRSRAVPRPFEVSYVRTRSWLICPDCGRSVVADDPKAAP